MSAVFPTLGREQKTKTLNWKVLRAPEMNLDTGGGDADGGCKFIYNFCRMEDNEAERN